MNQEAINKHIEELEAKDDLTKKERKRLKNLKKKNLNNVENITSEKNKKIIFVIIAIGITIAAILIGYKFFIEKSPEQINLEKQVKEVTLDNRIEEFQIEGRSHILGNINVAYGTSPPTSGNHFAQPANWGVYDDELDDRSVVHAIEHGGIWISYKNIDEETIKKLEKIGNNNSNSVIVSPRISNNNSIVVVSWGRMMMLDSLDEALIQKYINTYKNKSPEPLAR